MKKLFMAVGTFFCIVFFLAQTAFSWGWAVHTYIDDQFSTKWALRNGNQIYGGEFYLFNFRFHAPEYRTNLSIRPTTISSMSGLLRNPRRARPLPLAL